jgi:hypothetical protein
MTDQTMESTGTEAGTRTAVADARAALNDIGESLPEVARTSRAIVGDAMRAIERGTDQGLTTGATLSLGLAVGLLIGGAPRLLVLGALIPAAAIGLQMLDRQRVTTTSRSTRSSSS